MFHEFFAFAMAVRKSTAVELVGEPSDEGQSLRGQPYCLNLLATDFFFKF